MSRIEEQFKLGKPLLLLLGVMSACIAMGASAQEQTDGEQGQESAPTTEAIASLPWALEDVAKSATLNSAVPPLSQNLGSQKKVMLTLSVDHQLFLPAYNDYDDIYQAPGEPFEVPETTYTHSFNYSGYFDSNLCYSYAGNQFKAAGAANEKYCPNGGWSGNFLNWATMTRMDLVRFVLYGGYRTVDTANRGASEGMAATQGQTVLERAYLPQDAHSFAKYYGGSDIENLTDTAGFPGEATCATSLTPGATCDGFTFCNTTQPHLEGELRDTFSQDPSVMVKPPLLRVVRGNHSLWASNERYQCIASDEIPAGGFGVGQGKNRNIPTDSGIPAFAESPPKSSIKDHFVRVSVCDSSNGGLRESFCSQYEGDNYKPVGLLQEQGASGEVQFGLFTGSYASNKSFGALRKNISSFADELNSDGTFVYPALSQILNGAPADLPLQHSIIGNLNALRVVDYKFIAETDSGEEQGTWQGTYNDTCFWGLTDFRNGQCRNWGNPFSELLAESYVYFAQRDKRASDDVTDHELIPGLTVAPWPTADEIGEGDGEEGSTSEFACANMNVIGFNSSSVSYDNGERHADDGAFPTLAGVTAGDLFGVTDDASVQALTDEIGVAEGLATGAYFVGKVGGAGDGQCTPKTIAGGALSLVSGTCPEAPNAKGSYWGAGLAKFVRNNDIARDVDGTQTISTYGVTLSGASPKITVPVPTAFSSKIEVVPICRNRGNTHDGAQLEFKGNCSLVGFKPVKVFQHDGGDKYSASYYIGWEDSEQGGDYDLDLSGLIEVEISPADEQGAATLIVSTQIIDKSAVDLIEFGFVISGTGTGRDGAYFPTRVLDGRGEQADDWLDVSTKSDDCTPAIECYNDPENFHIQDTEFTISTGTPPASFLDSPLYYAAKWGSSDGVTEVDADGKWNGPGYANVADPSRLKETLGKVISNIIDKPVAGTGAAVATTALTGEGLILSTLFLPQAGDGLRKVDWVGRLNGLFRAEGETWEDSADPRGVRTDEDTVVRFFVKDSKTVFTRHQVSRDEEGVLTILPPMNVPLVDQDETETEDETEAEGEPEIEANIAFDYSKLEPVWNARDQLAGLNQATIQTDRPYGTTADRGRHIFTSVDDNNDGYTVNNDIITFEAGNFPVSQAATGSGSSNYQLLDVDRDEEDVSNLVNFIRGKEGINGFRNRTVTINGEPKAWLLGDITHSTPALVGRPNSLYDSNRLNDQTYREFRNHYANRRLVTYVGANDGMLHAFNAGFAQVRSERNNDGEILSNSLEYGTLPPVQPTTDSDDGPDPIDHPLGAELWAYVPYNLLPQLKWLSDPNYRHVYYVDSKVNQFDVNIFPDDDIHPNGWGTIIVVGMGFGGSPANLTVGEENITLRSAYMIFDVTDPERPPTLLGEITDRELGYTLGDIDVVSVRKPNVNGSYASPRANQWYLLFGSGPTDIATAASNQKAQLFSLDLTALAGSAVNPVRLGKLELPNEASYVGGLRVVDWDDDFTDDMVYFGTVGTDPDGDKGSLMQGALSFNATGGLSIEPSVLLPGVDLPFSRAPLAIKESDHGGLWVYASTGKFLVSGHLEDIDDNKLFGFRVNNDNAGVGQSRWLTNTGVDPDPDTSLKDVSGLSVHTTVEKDDDGEVMGRTFTVEGDGDNTTPDQVSEAIRKPRLKGWSRSLLPGEELSNTLPFYSGSTLGMSTYLPGVSGCSPTGKSRIYVLNMFNGLPQTESKGFVLLDVGGNVITDAGSDVQGEVAAHIEIDGPVNDPSPGDDPTVAKGDGGFLDPLPETSDGQAMRRSWREVLTE